MISLSKMLLRVFFVLYCCHLSLCASLSGDSNYAPKGVPKWSPRYSVAGVLSLPYAEIGEPFMAYYDGANKRSRVDFYGGMDITVQRGDQGDFGNHYMIAPMTTESKFNVKTCFELNGTQSAPISAQSVLPVAVNFSYTGLKDFNGINCELWVYKNIVGFKTNRYSLYVSKGDQRPIFYEMLGYDSLLGSHFDEYKVLYNDYTTDFEDAVFDKPMEGMTCSGFPGPGHEARVTVNPMQEFIHPSNDEHLHPMFEAFTKKFGKSYSNKNQKEYHHRKNIFKHNLRYINSMNRKGLSFRLKVNHLADQLPFEMRHLRGRRTTTGNGVSSGGAQYMPKVQIKDAPENLDWRLYGAVTPVKDQAVCGSCWSFGTTGTIEGAYFLKTEKLVRLSQQNLVDCSWGYGNNGCDGGEEFRAYQWMMKHGGIATEESYGRYLGADSYCHIVTNKVPITGYVNVTSGDLGALKLAVFEKGPVAVGIDASHLSFAFYSHGVYYEPKCGNTPQSLDHAVLAAGYGIMNGQAYWLVKNSWSTHWGNDGYVLMSQKDNNCGVATDATFVTM